MNKPRLSDDVSRCLDGDCPERETCLRWVCRDDDRDRGRLSFLASMKDPAQAVGDKCYNRIPLEWAAHD